MAGRQNNPPKRHHYIPIFYLKQWVGEDGRLVEFSRRHHGRILPRYTHPSGTGYQVGLYTLRGYEPELAGEVERQFFGTTDSMAAQVLERLKTYGPGGKWTSEMRSAWSRFILSLLLRSPEDLSAFRLKWAAAFHQADDEEEARYQSARRPTDPATFREFVDAMPEKSRERYMYGTYLPLIDNVSLGPKISNMIWAVVTTTSARHALLSSDRPVIRTGLGNDQAHIVLPIGPRKLFVAAREGRTIERAMATPSDTIVKDVNARVVEHAVRFVFASDERQQRFVENRFGGSPLPALANSF